MVISDFTKQEYSKQDFLKLIEHRIRKEIRQNSLLSTKQNYILKEQNSLQSQVLKHFLTQIFQGRLSLNGTKIIETDYLELFITKKLNVFLEGAEPNYLLEKLISPLRSITEHEVTEVSKILSLNGTFEPVQQDLIELLQTKYSQTKPSFLKSFSNIEQLDNDK